MMGVLSIQAAIDLATLLLRYRLALFEALPDEQKAAKAQEHEAHMAVGERLLDKIMGLLDKDDAKPGK